MRAPLPALSLPPLRALAAVLACLVAAGCGALSPTALPPAQIAVETASFTTDAGSQEVLTIGRSLARTFGMTAGFVDVGGGRYESDYVSLRSVQDALEDGLPGGPFLATTLVRFTVDTVPLGGGRGGSTVRIRATMRPTSGAYYPQRTPGRYWLDRYAATFAETVGATYTPTVTDAQYLSVLERGGDVRAPAEADRPRRGDLSRTLKIGGVVLLAVIVTSIVVTAN